MKHPRPEWITARVRAVEAAGVKVRAVVVGWDDQGRPVVRLETGGEAKPEEAEVRLG
jgi:hypothetical protein